MQIIPKNIVPPTWPLCRVVETSNKPRLQVFGYKVILYFIYVAKDKQNYQTSRRIFFLAINRITILNETVTCLLTDHLNCPSCLIVTDFIAAQL